MAAVCAAESKRLIGAFKEINEQAIIGLALTQCFLEQPDAFRTHFLAPSSAILKR